MRKIAIVAALLVCSVFCFSVVLAQRAPKSIDGGGLLPAADVVNPQTSGSIFGGPSEVAIGSIYCFGYGLLQVELHGSTGVVNGVIQFGRSIDPATDCRSFGTATASIAEAAHCKVSVEEFTEPYVSSFVTFVCHGDRDKVMRAVGELSDQVLVPGPPPTPHALPANRQ